MIKIIILETQRERKHMKRNKILMLLATASLLLSGCNEDNSSSISSSTSTSDNGDSSSSSTSGGDKETSVATDWSSSIKTLLKTYSGEVLPYPEKFTDGSKLSSSVDEDYGYLIISYKSSTFLLDDYYKALETKNWNTIISYNNNPYQLGYDSSDNEINKYESTKASSDGATAYDVSYYFVNGYNYIICQNSLVASKTTATEWSDDEKASFKYAITIDDIPFIQLGSDVTVTSALDSYYVGEDEVSIESFYFEDLTRTYAETLISDGYTVDKEQSEQYDMFVLSKDLMDGENKVATIYVEMYFFGYNYINFIYEPVKTSVSKFPSSLFDKVSGYEIPSFTASSYTYYIKNGDIHLSGETSTSIVETYEAALTDAGFVVYWFFSYYAQTFEEDVFIYFYDNYDDDDSSIISFELVVSFTSPSTPITKEWPSSKITTTLSSLGIKGVDVPSPTFTLGENDKGFKYYEETDDDKNVTGSVVEIYDIDRTHFASYIETLKNSLWWVLDSTDSSYSIEDPTGALKIDVSYEKPITYVVISNGSGKQHEATFAFSSSSVTVGQGKSKSLSLIQQMLPEGTITYSSSDETNKITVDDNGVVSVSSDAELNSTATITATLTYGSETKTATCEVKVVNEVIDTITRETLLNGAKAENKYKNYNLTSSESSVDYTFCAYLYEGCIQLNKKNSNSTPVGIVASSSDKVCSSITFNFNATKSVNKGQGFAIYGSDSAISLTDLYSNTSSLTKVGEAIYDGTSSLTIKLTGEYKYIGIVCTINAQYLDSISFTWH